MKIKIYSTPQCHFCHMLKDYLNERGIEYEDVDVSKDRSAAEEMVEKTGQMGVPVTDIEGDIVIGFDVPKLEEAISKHESGKPPAEEYSSSEVIDTDEIYDVVVIGGSSAGLSAGLYASRRELKTLIVSKSIGGQVAMTTDIENYPGIERKDGVEMINVFKKQAESFGSKIVTGEVSSVREAKDKAGKELFAVVANGDVYAGKAVIVATGKTPRSLGVNGEDEYTGKGVSYCATCDAPLFRDKKVVVVGGGNSAFDAALLLSKIAEKVYLVHRREGFRAFEGIVNEAKSKDNIEFVLNSVVEEVRGDKFLKSVMVKNKDSGDMREIEAEGMFVEVGSEVKTDFVKGLVKVDETNQIITNKNTETSHPGIFAAGDVTDTPFKQIVVAAGEGCKAALAAYNYIHGFENKYVTDWSA